MLRVSALSRDPRDLPNLLAVDPVVAALPLADELS